MLVSVVSRVPTFLLYKSLLNLIFPRTSLLIAFLFLCKILPSLRRLPFSLEMARELIGATKQKEGVKVLREEME